MSVPEKKNGGNNTPIAVASIIVLLTAGIVIYKLPGNQPPPQASAVQPVQQTPPPQVSSETSPSTPPRVVEAPAVRTSAPPVQRSAAAIPTATDLTPTIHDHAAHFGYSEDQRKKIAWDFMAMRADAAKKALKDDPARGPEIGNMIQNNIDKGTSALCKKYHITELQLKTIADEASDKNWPQPYPNQTI